MSMTTLIYTGDNYNNIKEYVDIVINLMKQTYPFLTNQELFQCSGDINPMQEEHIMKFTNIDLFTKNNNNIEERIDRVHFHIPYYLKNQYINYYIKISLIYLLFKEHINDAVEVVSIIKTAICCMASEQQNNIDILNESLLCIGELFYAMGYGAIQKSQFNEYLKINVLVNDFRFHPIIQNISQLMIPSANFFYDTTGNVNNPLMDEIDVGENQSLYITYSLPYFWYSIQDEYIVDGGNNNDDEHDDEHDDYDIDNDGNNNIRRNLLSEFNSVETETNIEEGNLIYSINPKNIRCGECPVCYDEIQISDYYNCIHGICITCFISWSNNYHNTCPVCRSASS